MVCKGFKMWGWEGLGQEASSGKRAVSSGEAVATWTVAGLSFWLKTTANAASIRWWCQPFPGMGVKTQNSNPTSLAKQNGPIFFVCVCIYILGELFVPSSLPFLLHPPPHHPFLPSSLLQQMSTKCLTLNYTQAMQGPRSPGPHPWEAYSPVRRNRTEGQAEPS